MRMLRLWRRGQRGSIAVETALTLPIMLLLTIGGLSVLWWLHNKAVLQLAVTEVARERAADAMLTGYYKDIRDTIKGPPQAYGLRNMQFVSFHLPVDPPFVMAAACTTPGGLVPDPPGYHASAEKQAPRQPNGGWLGPVQDVREFLEDHVEIVENGANITEGWADQAVAIGERLVFYRKALEGLGGDDAHQQRQAIDYVVGGVLELGMTYSCSRAGQTAVAAKAVIQGERTYPQR